MPINPSDFTGDPGRYHRAVMVSTLMDHEDHRVQITLYGDRTDPYNAAIECADCSTVLIDWNHPLMDADDSARSASR